MLPTKISFGLASLGTLGHWTQQTWWPLPLALGGLMTLSLTAGLAGVRYARRRGWMELGREQTRLLRKRGAAHYAAVAALGAGGATAAVWALGWTAAGLTGWLALTGALGAPYAWARRIRRRELAERRRQQDEAARCRTRALSAEKRAAVKAFRAAMTTASRVADEDGIGVMRQIAMGRAYELTEAETHQQVTELVKLDVLRRGSLGAVHTTWARTGAYSR